MHTRLIWFWLCAIKTCFTPRTAPLHTWQRSCKLYFQCFQFDFAVCLKAIISNVHCLVPVSHTWNCHLLVFFQIIMDTVSSDSNNSKRSAVISTKDNYIVVSVTSTWWVIWWKNCFGKNSLCFLVGVWKKILARCLCCKGIWILRNLWLLSMSVMSLCFIIKHHFQKG